MARLRPIERLQSSSLLEMVDSEQLFESLLFVGPQDDRNDLMVLWFLVQIKISWHDPVRSKLIASVLL